MIARISLSACLAACVMWPGSVSAQWKAISSPDKPKQAEQTPGEYVLGQSPDGSIELAGGYAPQSGVDSYGDGSGFAAGGVYQAQPMPWEREGDSPVRRFLTDVVGNGYFRVEYLNWNIDDVGAQVVGAPSALIPDPTTPPRQLQYQSNAFFGLIGAPTRPATSQTLVVPSLEGISFNRVSGGRLTYGIPTQFGRIELSGFRLEDATDHILDPSFGPVRGDRVLAAPEFQQQAFVLANNFVVNQAYVTTTAGTVLAVAQNIGTGQNLINNIPAGSQLPPSAFPFPPGNPPISIPPLPPGSQIRPLVDLANPLTGVITLNTPLPTGSFFTQLNFQGQLVTFDTSAFTILQANLQGTTPLTGPFYIRGANQIEPNPFSPLIAPQDMPNVFDPSRVPTAQFPDRFPGGDAIIIVPQGSTIFPTVSVLLADRFSPGGITLPAGTVLRTTETGYPAMPLTSNGQIGTSFLIFDFGYGADYHSEVWGTEAKMIFDIGPNANGLTLNPLVGFRYMSFDEQFRQVGLSTLNVLVLDQIQTAFVVPEPLRAAEIDSKVQNNLYGVQVGASAEYNNKYITLGVDPRISLGVNQYEAEVTTNQLRSILDVSRTTRQEDTTFAPVFDVNMYGQVHLTPYFSLHASYNFTYLFKVTRPAENIIYNDNGPLAPPGVVVDARTQDVHIQGLTVGGEFRFRDLKFR